MKLNKHKHKLSDGITCGILKSIEFRDNLYQRLTKLSTDSPDYELLKCNFKIYNRYLNQCIRNAKKDYYAREFNKYKGDIRKTWDILKDILNKKKVKCTFPAYFLSENEHVSGAQNIANKFNEYLTNIGPDLARSINTANKAPFDSYLNTPCSNSFLFQYTNPTDIVKIIGQLKPKSSSGCDNISSKLLKEITGSVSCPLSKINQSLCTGIVPSKLKLAKVITLYKKDDEKQFGNYHPISLLSSISKIFEKVTFDQLYDYLSLHDLPFDRQYGFRKHHSTEMAALELTDSIRPKKIPFPVFLDLSKASDTLNHSILLTKRKYYGMKDTPMDWFKSYLTHRHQYVEYDGIPSSTREIKTGVPQGSILGPLLFIIYMNYILNVSANLKFILYADDTTITSPLCSFTHGGNDDIGLLTALINLELRKISDWLAVNKLSLNVQKTKFLIFHNYQKVISANEIPDSIICETKIERETTFYFLGLTINEFINWSAHTSKIANKISRTLGVMNRLKSTCRFQS